jgi:hypothetical protein
MSIINIQVHKTEDDEAMGLRDRNINLHPFLPLDPFLAGFHNLRPLEGSCSSVYLPEVNEKVKRYLVDEWRLDLEKATKDEVQPTFLKTVMMSMLDRFRLTYKLRDGGQPLLDFAVESTWNCPFMPTRALKRDKPDRQRVISCPKLTYPLYRSKRRSSRKGYKPDGDVLTSVRLDELREKVLLAEQQENARQMAKQPRIVTQTANRENTAEIVRSQTTLKIHADQWKAAGCRHNGKPITRKNWLQLHCPAQWEKNHDRLAEQKLRRNGRDSLKLSQVEIPVRPEDIPLYLSAEDGDACRTASTYERPGVACTCVNTMIGQLGPLEVSAGQGKSVFFRSYAIDLVVQVAHIHLPKPSTRERVEVGTSQTSGIHRQRWVPKARPRRKPCPYENE